MTVMRCYLTGEECDCGAGMGDPCPHDETGMEIWHDDIDEDLEELAFARMSHQLDGDGSDRTRR